MRAFIAIEISDEIKDALARIESHLKYAGADVKWVNPKIIHLTLKFMGEINDNKCEVVKSALDAIAKSAKSFEVTVKDVGTFPNSARPRVIWLGLDKGASESVELAKRIEESLSKIGFPAENRPFSPHLTIGRVRSSLNIEKLKEKISSASLEIQPGGTISQKVTSIILFQSTLTPQGPIYTKLHEAPLEA
ncbi:MAG: RNA 2',3'-cyclic phosphodiesterase [Candidatus Omnitrophica bacterium]|nr:RNA 2',3'-cyclic phosphodiesterase [Candidatus Omnitrophota bacterium]